LQSCEYGWARGCGGLGECYKAGQGLRADPLQAILYFDKACRAGIAASCYAAGGLYQGLQNPVLAAERFQQACDVSIHAQIANTAYFRAGGAVEVAGAVPYCAQPAQ
jgi:TPR repeat protein